MLMLVHIVINSVSKPEKPRGPRLWTRLQGSNRLGVSRKAGNCRITEGDYIIVFERHFKRESTLTKLSSLGIWKFAITL
jgi:hypothetical protein